MIKKILMGIGVLAILGVVAVGGFSYYAYDKFTSEFDKRVPEFRQYVTMTTKEQNAYISKNLDEVQVSMLPLLGADSADIQEVKIFLKELDKNPEFMQAKINWGRSLVARLILLNSDEFAKNLSPEILKQLQAENDEYEVRLLEYRKQMNLYKSNQK